MRFLLTSMIVLISIISSGKEYSSEPTPEEGKHFSYLNRANYTIGVLNAGIGMPPHFINGRMHPGIEIGFRSTLKKHHRKSYLNYSVSLGYFSIQSLQRVSYMKPGIGYSLFIKPYLSIRPSIQASLLLVQQINDEFTYVGNGQYEKVSRFRFQTMPSLGMEAAFYIKETKKLRLSLLARYEFGVQLPFSEISSILPINQLHVGLILSKNHH